MGFIADSLNRIQPSATIAVSTKARQLAAQGRDIVSLSAGEPDFDTPQNIKDAAKRALDEGKTKYTDVDGIPELKAAIAAKFKRDNGLDYKPSQVSVGTGGKQVLYNALLATLNPGDEVVIPAPCWVSYADIVHARRRQAGLRRNDDRGRLQAEARSARKGDHAEDEVVHLQFAVESDRNGLFRGATSRRLLTFCCDHEHVWVLTDDMYEHLLYDGLKFATPAQVEPRLYDRTLTMNGLSKAYCMTGWRLGYAAGPEPLINAMRKLQSQSTSNPSSIVQWAGVEALNGPQDFIAEAQQDLRRAPRSRRQHAQSGEGLAVPEAARRILRLSEHQGADRQDEQSGHQDQE